MTPRIVYKQRHTDSDSGRKYTPARNANYIQYIGERVHVIPTTHEQKLVKYIGEREHVEHRLEAPNGLFGVINGKFSDDYSTHEMQQYVRKMTTPHRNIYHSIFSFTPTSAEEAGLHTLDDWEKWVKYNISEIADNMDVKIENLEYLAAVHLKEGQPHVHIIWWDKTQQVYINKIEAVKCDQIRIDVTQNTYKHLHYDILNKEDDLIKGLRKDIGSFAEKNIFGAEVSDVYCMEIMARIQHIMNILPPEGQFAYGFMPDPVKKEIDNLTNFIIVNNPAFKQQYEEICNLRLLYNEMLHSETSVYGNTQIQLYLKKLQDEINRKVGNTILKVMKTEKKAGRLKRTEEPEQLSYEEHWEDIVFSDNFDEEHYNNLTEEQMTHNEDWADVTFLDEEDNAKSTKGKKYKRSPMQWSDDFKNAKKLASYGDYEGALELYKLEAEKSNPLALYEIADLYRKTLLEGENPYGYYKSALDIFKEIEPTTRKLKPYVQYRIGRMYYDGYGTDKNFETAFYWLKLSADGRNHNAEYTLGRMLYTGTGTEQDKVTAIDYLQRAAKEVSAACIYLGNIELNDNKDSPHSEANAIDWYTKAVDMKNADGAYKLHKIYRKKEDTQDLSIEYLNKAIDLYSKRKDINAKLMLGKIYADPDTPKYNFNKAEELLLRAATHKDIDVSSQAAYPLANLYLRQGVTRYSDALKWFVKAFNYGNNYSVIGAAKILCASETKFYNIQAAKNWLTKALERATEKESEVDENLVAQLNYKLGKIYASEKEEPTAIKYLDAAIRLYEKQDDIKAVFMLGKIYADPDTPKYDFNKAEELLLRAATYKDKDVSSQAAYPLANLYLRQGVTRYSDALKWFVKAFDSGNNYSAIGAAKILCDNESELYNIEAAKDWLTKALERATSKKGEVDKNVISQLNYKLGKLYILDEKYYYPRLAEHHLKQAVQLGNAYAMYSLAKLYLSDESFDKLDIALLLLENAKIANKDISPFADFTLGVTYLYNDKVKDIVLGKQYLTASANAGNEFAKQVLDSFNSNCIVRMLTATGRLLDGIGADENAALNNCAKSVFGRGDLSKEQIKELLLKIQDKENTAEM